MLVDPVNAEYPLPTETNRDELGAVRPEIIPNVDEAPIINVHGAQPSIPSSDASASLADPFDIHWDTALLSMTQDSINSLVNCLVSQGIFPAKNIMGPIASITFTCIDRPFSQKGPDLSPKFVYPLGELVTPYHILFCNGTQDPPAGQRWWSVHAAIVPGIYTRSALKEFYARAACSTPPPSGIICSDLATAINTYLNAGCYQRLTLRGMGDEAGTKMGVTMGPLKTGLLGLMSRLHCNLSRSSLRSLASALRRSSLNNIYIATDDDFQNITIFCKEAAQTPNSARPILLIQNPADTIESQYLSPMELFFDCQPHDKSFQLTVKALEPVDPPVSMLFSLPAFPLSSPSPPWFVVSKGRAVGVYFGWSAVASLVATHDASWTHWHTLPEALDHFRYLAGYSELAVLYPNGQRRTFIGTEKPYIPADSDSDSDVPGSVSGEEEMQISHAERQEESESSFIAEMNEPLPADDLEDSLRQWNFRYPQD
ncbi:hypothetical protein C8J56DRAFT_1037956 [Mycena floridula]|nr:hypothetical protein C8J56DRAFT_1037956 [Mycena floridula]